MADVSARLKRDGLEKRHGRDALAANGCEGGRLDRSALREGGAAGCPSLKKRIFSTNELMEIAIVKRDQTLAEHPRGPILWEGATGTLKPKTTRVFDEQTIGNGNYRA